MSFMIQAASAKKASSKWYIQLLENFPIVRSSRQIILQFDKADLSNSSPLFTQHLPAKKQ